MSEKASDSRERYFSKFLAGVCQLALPPGNCPPFGIWPLVGVCPLVIVPSSVGVGRNLTIPRHLFAIRHLLAVCPCLSLYLIAHAILRREGRHLTALEVAHRHATHTCLPNGRVQIRGKRRERTSVEVIPEVLVLARVAHIIEVVVQFLERDVLREGLKSDVVAEESGDSAAAR